MLKVLEDLKQREIIQDVTVKKRIGDTRMVADFWVTVTATNVSMVLEMDGEQHTIPTIFNASGIQKTEVATKQFAMTQTNDLRKNDWCAANGIHMLRIGYKISFARYSELVVDFVNAVRAATNLTPLYKNITHLPRRSLKGRPQKPRTQENVLTRYPELVASEWDFEKNTKNPETYGPFSKQLVYWKCATCKHSWEGSIGNRTGLGSGCPRCRFPPSKAELHMEAILKQCIADRTIHSFETQKRLFDSRLRCDFWVSVTDTVFMVCEMDGEHHEINRAFNGSLKKGSAEEQLQTVQTRDQQKKDLCLTNHVHLLRITFRVKPEDYAAEVRDFLSAVTRLPKTETLFRRVGGEVPVNQ